VAHSAEGPTLAAINSILSELADVADIHDAFERRTYIDCVFRLLSDTSINWRALKNTRALNYAALLDASKKLRTANAALQALGDDEKEWISLCLADGSDIFRYPALGRSAKWEHIRSSPFEAPQSERLERARDWASIIGVDNDHN
jgi:hypothetical protein